MSSRNLTPEQRFPFATPEAARQMAEYGDSTDTPRMELESKTFRAAYGDYAIGDAMKWLADNPGAIQVNLDCKQLEGAIDGFNGWVATLQYTEAPGYVMPPPTYQKRVE